MSGAWLPQLRAQSVGHTIVHVGYIEMILIVGCRDLWGSSAPTVERLTGAATLYALLPVPGSLRQSLLISTSGWDVR